ncbi:purine nucleoside phosphorylase [Enterobacter cloacae]|uniref:Purine nucleoside phosphorylase n=1 Tax=Enterobacter cloacae TaxID=550 RepID=A0A377MA68_ENTCL|nr:purine nucleoside phosphorylase [Enterobacter cloacae]
MDVKLRDVVIGMGACTDSKVNRMRFKDHDFAAIADFGMVRNAVDAAKALGVDARVGNLFSADLFYAPDGGEMFDVMENTASWAWKWKRRASTASRLSSVRKR